MKKVTVLLPIELRRSLENIARQRGVSMSAIAREAIEVYVAKQLVLPSIFGSVADGSFDASRDEEYLAEHWKPDWYEESSDRSD